MKDHHGSIRALVDENGDFAERYAYYPCSRFVETCEAGLATKCNPVRTAEQRRFHRESNRKNPDNWSVADSRTEFIIDRGYTSHVPYCSKSTSKAQYFWQTVAIPYKPECSGGFIGKHNDLLGMINANGRYYDPILGEFISPDPYVQMPGNAQNFNRYAYCLNNPVSYSDPTGEFFWVIPSIGWSMEGGLTVGVSVALGIPGGLSAQGGISYSYKNSSNNGFAAYVGGSFLFNTAYVAYSENSGFSVGYTAGLSPQTGLPISTNALTVGVNYNITNNEWSGNISALYLSESGRPTFNLSVSAMVYPEHTTNWVKGKGFTNNRQVFQNFKDGVYNIPDQSSWEQEAINYFCGQGTYREDVPKGHTGLVDEPVTYYGATNIDNGNIYFGELALTSYDNLIQTFYKERYTSNKIRKGKGVMTAEIDIKEFEYYPEEALGFQHSYRYSGLYRGASVDSYGLANSYWLQVYGTHLINHKNLFYNIRRLW